MFIYKLICMLKHSVICIKLHFGCNPHYSFQTSLLELIQILQTVHDYKNLLKFWAGFNNK